MRNESIWFASKMCEEQGKIEELEKFLVVMNMEGMQDGGVVEGLPYRLHRNQWGSWCGYVGVFHDHPAYNKDYNDLENDIQVHGGITFAGKVHEWGHGNLWWLGFDTGHCNDLNLINLHFPDFPNQPITYKNKRYTIKECRDLAKQLNEMTRKK